MLRFEIGKVAAVSDFMAANSAVNLDIMAAIWAFCSALSSATEFNALLSKSTLDACSLKNVWAVLISAAFGSVEAMTAAVVREVATRPRLIFMLLVFVNW